MKRGKFIVIDGIDGSGKTTQIRMLQKWLGSRAVFAHDPGGTPTGEQIRGFVLGAGARSRVATLFLFLASRAVLTEEVIEPALKKGKIVVCDRFDSSTYAYQVVAEKRSKIAPLLKVFSQKVLGLAVPDAYIILDSDPKEAKKRLAKKPGELNAYDRKPLAYHRGVRAGFKRFKPMKGKIYFVNADRTPEAVFADVKPLVQKILG